MTKIKPGTLIKIVKAMPGISEDAKQYANGDIFEVGFEWQCGGGVTTTQNLELFNWEFVVFAEEVVEFGEKPPTELMWGDVEPINPPAEPSYPQAVEFVDGFLEATTARAKADAARMMDAWEASIVAGPAIVVAHGSGEPTVTFIGEAVEDKVDHPSHYTQGKFETIEVIEEFTQGYEDSYVGYCVGNVIKYLARAPHKHDTPVEDLRKAAKYLEFALAKLEK